MSEIKVGDKVRYVGDFPDDSVKGIGAVKRIVGAGTELAFAAVEFNGEEFTCSLTSLERDAEPAYNPATNWIIKPAEDVRAEVEAGWQAAEDEWQVDHDANNPRYQTRCTVVPVVKPDTSETDYSALVESQQADGGADILPVVKWSAPKPQSMTHTSFFKVLCDILGRNENATDEDMIVHRVKALQDANSEAAAWVAALQPQIERLQADIVALTTRNRALVERAEKAEAEAAAMRTAMIAVIGDAPTEETVKDVGAFFWAVATDVTLIRFELAKILRKALETNAGADLLARVQAAEADRDAARAALDTLRTQSLETENAMHQQLDEIHHIVFAAGRILGSADGNNLQDAVTEAFKLLDR